MKSISEMCMFISNDLKQFRRIGVDLAHSTQLEVRRRRMNVDVMKKKDLKASSFLMGKDGFYSFIVLGEKKV